MKIIMSAGGTGGHIYPALTLADELKDKGHEIMFIGSSSRMEKDLIPSFGYKFIGLDMDIVSGSIINKGRSLLKLYKAYKECLKLMKGYDLAIGFGNYISVPVLKAAKKLGMKIMIHEQNSFAGKANKMLDKDADLVIGSYEENKKQFKNPNTLILGNPQSAKAYKVKKDKKVISELGLGPNKKTVVIFMGSLGSMTVNKVVLDYLDLLDGTYQVVYASGKQNYESVLNKNINRDYIKCFERVDGAKMMINADLLVCRAGATTLAEITSIGTPSIIIPSPYVPNNHQFFNAKALVDKDAALMIEEKDLSASKLKETIDSIINDDSKLESLRRNALSLGNPNVLNDILEAINRI